MPVTNVSGLLPSQVTDDYWSHAESPAVNEADECRTGKWLVFVPARQVDRWWELIPIATEQGRLGISAKAATARHNELATSQQAKLICAYTRDWQDQGDVRCVLRQLRNLGVTWRLSYKTDEATLSGVYGTGSAIYASQPGSPDFDDRTHRPEPPEARARGTPRPPGLARPGRAQPRSDTVICAFVRSGDPAATTTAGKRSTPDWPAASDPGRLFSSGVFVRLLTRR